MIIIVHSETNEHSLEARLGLAEYSYYFVLKEFLPALARLGRVVVVKQPDREVDPIFHEAEERGEACVFLSFSPPNRTPLGLDCPTIPVFAWEFDAISSETWYCEREQDWRFVLDRLGQAITHSAHTASTVMEAMGEDFPIGSIPAPVWDRFAPYFEARKSAVVPAGTSLSVVGEVVDTRSTGLSLQTEGGAQEKSDVELDGVVFLSILNPSDGRKNIFELIGAFCEAFRDIEDATLVLKLTHHAPAEAMSYLRETLERLAPFECRVLLLSGYLDTETYEKLVATATYAVNASVGEGQCLPLMEPMSCGKPAIAPDHSGMADYVDEENAFIVESSPEPSAMPQDPRYALRSFRRRIDVESLVAAYREGYHVAKFQPERYARMSRNAYEALRRHCSLAVVEDRLSRILARRPRPSKPDMDFGRIKPRESAPWMREISSDTRVMECSTSAGPMALLFGRLGAKVDVICPTQRSFEDAETLVKHSGIGLSLHSGEVGLNPAGVPSGYDFILLDGQFARRSSAQRDALRLSELLSPNGKFMVASMRLEAVPANKPDADDAPDIELVRLLGSIGFARRRSQSNFLGPAVPVYEFVRWTDPLLLSGHHLTPEEEVCWHGIEPHGRWTKANAFLEIPSREGEIEITVQNHRRSHCAGRMSLGKRTVKFKLAPGESRKIRLAQSGSQRLDIRSNVDDGGPADSRLLGLYVVSLNPL
jgi:glycosyltransferase involved in cell wall biosynthesis